ncbi:MAG TPA: ZIP family metal transporter [Burkholderiaceae bacterium]|nr:ZIP family metal transporter [Burkholderiaceae bacterium]
MAATAVSTVVSITAAAWFSFALLTRMVERMVAFSVGILLGAALLHMLPEAMESHVDPHHLFALLLAALIGFFLLEKFAFLRHSHHHEGDGHHHAHGFDRAQAGRGGLPMLLGDGLHNFADGILIAAAFLVDARLGLIAAASIVAHEIPQEVGDFMVLLNAGFTKRRAYLYNLLSGFSSVLGGIVGWMFLERSSMLIPYALVIASASFIYIALSDLMPQLQREGRRGETFWHIALIGLGLAIVYAIFSGRHAH